MHKLFVTVNNKLRNARRPAVIELLNKLHHHPTDHNNSTPS